MGFAEQAAQFVIGIYVILAVVYAVKGVAYAIRWVTRKLRETTLYRRLMRAWRVSAWGKFFQALRRRRRARRTARRAEPASREPNHWLDDLWWYLGIPAIGVVIIVATIVLLIR